MPAKRQYLLIDGYNIIHSWPDLREIFLRDIDAAAGRLVEMLAVLHDADTMEVTIVFDGRGDRLQLNIEDCPTMPCVIYTPTGTTADAIIEQIVSKAPDATAFTVASRDNALCMSVYSRGALVMTPDELLNWTTRERRSIASSTAKNKNENARNFGNKLFGGI